MHIISGGIHFAPHAVGMSGIIAIVGRPNVGKSALFNRMAGRRIAIVHDQPGVTRDRITAEAEWRGHPYTLMDTGGIGLLRRERSEDVIVNAALDQVEMAIEAASVILFVVNVQEGIVPLDEEVARRLRSFNKPVLVVANKVDHGGLTDAVDEFSRLGFPKIFPVSAIHGRGMDILQDNALNLLLEAMGDDESPTDESGEGAEAAEWEEEPKKGSRRDRGKRKDGLSAAKARSGMDEDVVRIAIVGRPNVGKSSLINKLTGSDRVVVSPIAGTTRDAVDVPFEVDTEGVRQKYVLIDTAGVRKARRRSDFVEIFSVERTQDAIGRSDITVLVLDAAAGILEQDKKIADMITSAHRACVVLVNKWDLVAEEVRIARQEALEEREEEGRERYERPHIKTTLSEFGAWVQEKLFFLDYAPVIFTSATEGFQLDRFLESIRYVAGQLRQKVPTAVLNRCLQDAIERRQPISDLGHRLKFFYATQVKQSPPTFVMFVNRKELFSPQYEKYLGGQLRRSFGFEGCPLVLIPRARPKTIDPVRSRTGAHGGTSRSSSGASSRPGARPPQQGRRPGKGSAVSTKPDVARDVGSEKSSRTFAPRAERGTARVASVSKGQPRAAVVDDASDRRPPRPAVKRVTRRTAGAGGRGVGGGGVKKGPLNSVRSAGSRPDRAGAKPSKGARKRTGRHGSR